MPAAFNAPIPGQGLTQDPDSKLAYERPPQEAELNKLVVTLFDELTSKRILPEITAVLKDGVKLDQLVSAYIEQGLVAGRWNADMAHLLIEPLTFTFMWIASQVGAPVKFSGKRIFSSDGLDLLEVEEQEELEEVAESLLAPQGVANGQ